MGPLRRLGSFLFGNKELVKNVRHFTLNWVPPPKSWESREEEQFTRDFYERFYLLYLADVGVRGESDELEEHEELEGLSELAGDAFVRVDPRLMDAIKSWDLDQVEEVRWIRELNQLNMWHQDMILALLLPALPRLETLELDGTETKYLNMMMRKVVRREKPFDVKQAFQALRVFACSDNMYQRGTEFLASLLQLPAIMEIRGCFGVSWSEDEVSAPEASLVALKSHASALTSLHLAVYQLSTENLGHVLRAPRALKTFAYRAVAPKFLNFRELRDALRSQEDWLETLSILYDEAEMDKLFPWGDVPPTGFEERFGAMTSFASFKALKIFKLEAPFLEIINTGSGDDISPQRLINIFPSSLETLQLTHAQHYYEELINALNHLVSCKAPDAQIPSLTRIILQRINSVGKLSYLNRMLRQRQSLLVDLLRDVAGPKEVVVEVVEGAVEMDGGTWENSDEDEDDEDEDEEEAQAGEGVVSS